MKIAISWTFWTGKTAIANALSVHFSLDLISETAREIITSKSILPQDMTKELRSQFQKAVLKSQLEKEMLYSKWFISDATVFDILAYTRHNSHKDYLETVSLVREHYKNSSCYDIVFYTSVQEGIEKDWIRYSSKRMQSEVDIYLCDIYREFWVRKLPLLGSIEQMITEATRLLSIKLWKY